MLHARNGLTFRTPSGRQAVNFLVILSNGLRSSSVND
jgi:hypothetical protein